MVGNDETNFPHKFLLTNREVENLRKALANKSSTDINLSKTQLPKMIQPGGFLGRLLGPLLKTGLPLIKNAIKSLAKSVLIPLGLTAAADAGIHKKVLGSGRCHSSPFVLRSSLHDALHNTTRLSTSLADQKRSTESENGRR